MLKHRLVIFLTLAAVATASIAVAVAAYIQRLPEPETADRQGLFRWLVQTHLREEPQDIQTRLLNRVEQELANGIDLTQSLSQIDSAQRSRLLENVDRLAECWFFREAERFYAEPESGRIDVAPATGGPGEAIRHSRADGGFGGPRRRHGESENGGGCR